MHPSSFLPSGQGQLEGFEHLGASSETVAPPILDGQQWHSALEVAVCYAEKLEDLGSHGPEKPKLSAIFVDVDRLKIVNDTFGHQVGDRVIDAVTSAALKLNAQNDITAGRVGGDEFALFVWSNDENESARLSSELKKELAKFAEDYEEGILIDTGLDLSIGTSEYTHGMSASDLLKAADDAMYREKISRNDFSKLQRMSAQIAKRLLRLVGVRQRDFGRILIDATKDR